MSNKLFLPLLAISLCGTGLWADQIVMKNGDRVTGSIVVKDAKTLTIKTEHFGVVTLPWDQVSSVTAEKPLTVVLSGGQTVQGSLTTAGEKLEVASGGTKQTVAPTEIAAIRDEEQQRAYLRMLNPGWGDLWAISANIGLAGTSGNAKTATFTTPVKATRITNNDKTTAYFNFIRASASVDGVSAATAQAVRGGWAYNRNLRPKLFATGFNDYEYDRFQNLDLRVVLGGGLGYIAWKGENGRLDLVGGGAWNRETFDPIRPQQKFTRNSAEAYWGNDFNFKMSSRITFFESYRMFNNLSNTGEFRQNADAGITTALTKWLTWNAAVSDRYLSNPVPGRKKNDFLYTMGLGIVIAR
jgi:putative salt-induced outer membrane protein YdiY